MKASPQISLNKLGEYINATPVRRRAIIKGQRDPSPVIVPRYQKAHPILEKYFSSRNVEHLQIGIEKLRLKAAKTEWEAEDNANTALALETFAQFADQFDLADFDVKRANPQEASKLRIADVAVSVRPDFYLHFVKRGQAMIGAIKFHWIKNDDHQLTPLGRQSVATTIHHFLDQFGLHDAKVALAHCYSVDIFRRAISSAPTGYKRMRSQIEAACEEIALRWNTP